MKEKRNKFIVRKTRKKKRSKKNKI